MWDPRELGEMGSFIDGSWCRQATTSREIVNPTTGAVLAAVPMIGAGEASRAIESAAAAGPPPTIDDRASLLESVGRALLEHREELGRLIMLENGKPLIQAIAEVEYAAGFFGVAARGLSALVEVALPQPSRGCRWRVVRRPAGVAVLITPWNFPLSQLCKKVAGAIGAGCPVVAKPSELTPLSAIALWRVLLEAGVPPRMIQLVIGEPAPIGKVACEHPAVRLISFTGSTRVGRLLLAGSAAGIKRTALELGGNAPFVVFDDADLDIAVEALLASKFRTCGQTCVCPNRVLVQRGIMDSFVGRIVERASEFVVGDGASPGTDLGPLIHRDAWDKVDGLIADAVDLGASVALGNSHPRPQQQWGAFHGPVVLTGVTSAMRLWHEEIFGPVVPVTAFDDEAEAVTLANSTSMGLAAYVSTGSPDRGARVAAALEVGHVAVNSGTGPIPQAPFGGMKQSGFGREGGIEGVLEFTELQTVAVAEG